MAFENLGIGAILSFQHQGAVRNMRESEQAFGGLIGSAQRLQRGMRNVSAGTATMGASMLAATAPVALGAKTAMSFSAAMSGVAAVSGSSASEIAKLRQAAVDFAQAPLGYGPTEIANAMENLARAGFSTNEIMASTGGVLSAAAAEGMPLAEAAEIISIALRGMGLEASQSGHVADALASISAKTITSIRGLGEAFSYSAGQARTSGLSFDETAGLIGLMAERGIDASMAGTSMVQFLNDLANPTKKAQEQLARMGLNTDAVRIRSHGLAGVVKNLRGGFSRLSEVERERAAAILSDVRGARVFTAVIQDQTGRLDELVDASRRANGEAQKMAERRLTNLPGAFKIAGNSAQAFWVTLFNDKIQGQGAALVGGLVDKLNQITWAMGAISSGQDPIAAITAKMKTAGSVGEFMGGRSGFLDPAKMAEIGRGIYDGFIWVRDGVTGLFQSLSQFGEKLGLGKVLGDGRSMAKFATAAVLVSAALGPVLLGITGLTFASGGLFKLLGGGTDIVTGLVGSLASLATAPAAIGMLHKSLGQEGFAKGFTELMTKTGGAQGKLGMAMLGMASIPKGPGEMMRGLAGGIAATNRNILGLIPGAGKAGAALRGVGGAVGAGLLRSSPVRTAALGIATVMDVAGDAAGKVGGSRLVTGLLGGLGTIGGRLAPVFAPLAAALGPIGSAMGVAFAPLGALLAPILPIVGVLVGGFLLLRKEGESVGQTLSRIGGAVVGFFMKAVAAIPRVLGQLKAIVMPLFVGLAKATEPIATVFQKIFGDVLKDVGGTLKPVFGAVFVILKTVFQVVGGILGVVGKILKPIMGIVSALWPAARLFIQMNLLVFKFGAFLVSKLAPIVGTVFSFLVDKVGWFVEKIASVAEAIVKFILSPIRLVTGLIADLLKGIAGFAAKKMGIDLTDTIAALNRAAGRASAAVVNPGAARFSGAVGPYGAFTQRPEPASLLRPDPRQEFLLGESVVAANAAGTTVVVNPAPANPTPVNMETTTNINMDGEQIAHAVEKRRLEVGDRAGANLTPWQRRLQVVSLGHA